eukprot:1158909-Pelagomonas_calceolata.AAC.1
MPGNLIAPFAAQGTVVRCSPGAAKAVARSHLKGDGPPTLQAWPVKSRPVFTNPYVFQICCCCAQIYPAPIAARHRHCACPQQPCPGAAADFAQQHTGVHRLPANMQGAARTYAQMHAYASLRRQGHVQMREAEGSHIPPILLSSALQHGAKGLAMRLRITYKDATGQAVTDQAEVGRFPPGF